MVMRDGKPWLVLGTPGGHSINQMVPQMVMNAIDFGMDVQDALSAARIAYAGGDRLMVERAVPEAVRRELESRGHNLQVVGGLGNAHALSIEYGPNGRPVSFTGASDPRGEGLAQGR